MERKEIMKKLLLITGDLATGKSTFADILSKRYDTNVFYKDTIKEVLGDTIGFSNREENLKLSKATMELMIFMFKEFCKIDKNLILEANFRKVDLERLHEIAYENGYDVFTLAIHGEVEILHKRYLNRMNNENRHPVHLSTTLDIFDDFKEVFICTYVDLKRCRLLILTDLLQAPFLQVGATLSVGFATIRL
jgi:predicted kinase